MLLPFLKKHTVVTYHAINQNLSDFFKTFLGSTINRIGGGGKAVVPVLVYVVFYVGLLLGQLYTSQGK